MELVAEKYKQTALGLIPCDWNVFMLNDLLNGIADVNHYMPKTEINGIPYVMTGDLKEQVDDIDFEKCKNAAFNVRSVMRIVTTAILNCLAWKIPR